MMRKTFLLMLLGMILGMSPVMADLPVMVEGVTVNHLQKTSSAIESQVSGPIAEETKIMEAFSEKVGPIYTEAECKKRCDGKQKCIDACFYKLSEPLYKYKDFVNQNRLIFSIPVQNTGLEKNRTQEEIRKKLERNFTIPFSLNATQEMDSAFLKHLKDMEQLRDKISDDEINKIQYNKKWILRDVVINSVATALALRASFANYPEEKLGQTKKDDGEFTKPKLKEKVETQTTIRGRQQVFNEITLDLIEQLEKNTILLQMETLLASTEQLSKGN